MKLRLTTNLGFVDARKHGLTVETAREGRIVDLSDESAKELIGHGWAVEPGKKAGTGTPPNSGDFDDTPGGVLARESVTGGDEDEDDETDFDAMTKEELKEYADENDIAGVTMAMAKDDMLKAVKRGARRR